MPPSTPVFLSSVRYCEPKRQVVVEFSGPAHKSSLRYSFFPKMHFPPGSIAQERFFEVVRGCNGQRFKTDFSSNIATVYAATFSDLKRLSNMLAVCFGTYYTLIEPERQFLIEKGWNYFDSFEEKMIYRTTKTENPETSLKMVRKVLQRLAAK